MNKLQQVASAISGYDPQETSARDDFYYDSCPTELDKVIQIFEYAENVLKICLQIMECVKIYRFLEKECSQDERYHLFNELK